MDELVGRVNRYNNGQEYPYWNEITDLRLIWCREWNQLFEFSVETDEDSGITKTFTARSLGEAELGQLMLYDIEINTENDIGRDDYEVTVLYDRNNVKGSLLHRIMEKAPHYSIKSVSSSIQSIQRTFEFDGTSIYDAFQDIAKEIGCFFDIQVGFDAHGNIDRSIYVYDLESYCSSCGHRGDFITQCPECGSTSITQGYGTDTSIFVSTENLADSITYSTDTDSVKNCFKLEAGDDLMTATVVNCNPNGSAYIWYISDEQKKDMSPELVQKLESYDELYASYQKSYPISLNSTIVSQYNSLIPRYQPYNPDLVTMPATLKNYPELMSQYYNVIDFALFLEHTMMPSAELDSTSAQQEVAKLTAANLSPVAVLNLNSLSTSSASSAVLGMAKVVVDPRYQVKVETSSFSSSTWQGSFRVTSYSDDEDVAVSPRVSITINGDYQTYLQ